GAMIIDKLLTRKGWRVVAHSLLAAAGIGLLYLLSGMVVENIEHGTLSWWILGVSIALALWLVTLGSILAKAELSDWK
ncbi:MAG: hypothetical protein JW732_01320, partial [Dehalococcoidia bacterium]|nr:hypothetical protein [Dehalococcoidia bacterium]